MTHFDEYLNLFMVFSTTFCVLNTPAFCLDNGNTFCLADFLGLDVDI